MKNSVRLVYQWGKHQTWQCKNALTARFQVWRQNFGNIVASDAFSRCTHTKELCLTDFSHLFLSKHSNLHCPMYFGWVVMMVCFNSLCPKWRREYTRVTFQIASNTMNQNQLHLTSTFLYSCNRFFVLFFNWKCSTWVAFVYTINLCLNSWYSRHKYCPKQSDTN